MTRYLLFLGFFLFSFLIDNPAISQVNLTNGLVAYYPFNGNPNDASGNNHHGITVNGPSLTTDRFGNPNSAYQFDGIDDYIRIADNGAFSTPGFSIALWFQSESDALQNLIGKADYGFNNGAQYQFFINYAPFPGIGSNVVTNNNTCSATSSSSYINTQDQICKSRWYFAVVVFEPAPGGTTHKIYIDGVLKKNVSAGTLSMLTSCQSDLRFGNWWSGDLIPFKGKMDDIRWYNRALNAAEVTTLFSNFPSTSVGCGAPFASFTSADTVCVNSPLQLNNLSVDASSYYWNFCSPDVNNPPTGTLINNPGNLSYPAFIDYAYQNGNYYGFVINNDPGGLVRLDFGSSLLNTPTSTFLGTFGGAVTINGQGIHIVNNNGNWIGIFAGGEIASVGPRIVKLDFGTSLTNTPVATNWGNVGGVLNYPTDIYVFKEGGTWYGLTVNYRGHILTRLNFGTSFSGTPTATNLGNVGSLNFPNAFYPINDNGTWRVFIANNGDNSLSRVDFGTSLLNAPSGVNLGNVGGVLNSPSDLHIFNNCGQYTGYLVNGGNNTLVKLLFANLISVPSAISLGNVGTMNAPHSISRIFRIGSDIYAFAVNLNSNSLTRLKFSGCSNASIPSSTVQSPPAITFNAAGTYKITLVTDEGLSSQSSICKQVVVINPPVIATMTNTTICPGDSATLNPSVNGATSYSWSPTTGLSNPNILNPRASPATTTQYTLNASNGYCSSQRSVTVNVLAKVNPDFTYTQTSCSPKTIQFNNLTPTITSVFWDFGNSTTNSVSQSPVVTYASYGNYVVKLKVQTTSGCLDSVTKNIPVTVLQDSLIRVADTTICLGGSVQLNTFPALNFCWGNTPGLSNTSIVNPVATPTATSTYFFTSQSPGANLVVNGNFSAGNSGFQSDYISNFPNTAAAQYWVGPSPAAWWSTFPNCGDHTTGSGDMMMVNGATIIGAKVWQQTITVTPNTNYAFSTWLKSLDPTSPANLRFSINNNILGNNVQANASTCVWEQFYATWNSGNNTNAIITIVNNNSAFSGNDFALDDISFAQVSLKQDSIKITVADPPVLTITPASSICPGDSIPLNVTGASSYSWSPVAGLSNTAIANPLASPATTTKYIVTAYDLPGCTKKDSVTITVRPKPVISKSNDTTKCTGTAGVTIFASSPGATQYSWTPTSGLSDPSVSNPVANPAATNTYKVQVTGSNGCKNIDSVKVTVLPFPTVNTRSDTSVCSGTPVVLNTSHTGATTFSWSPTTGLSDPNIANPVASPMALTPYTVTASNGYCAATASVTIDVRSLPTVSKSNDTTICDQGQAQLLASGGNSYLWFPSGGLSNPNVPNPTASPTAATKYYVTVTGSNGCKKTDSVTVNWNAKPVFTITPPTIAICMGDSTLLSASGADTYNWYAGANILSPITASTIVKPSSTQQYSVAVRHNFCKLNDTLHSTVAVNNLPVVTVSKSNDIDCSNASATLTATGGVTYNWSPAINISAGNTANPVVSPPASTTYIVKVTNNSGCIKYDSVGVMVVFNPLTGGYNVPDAFTPNNDKKNDCFGIKYWGAVETFDLSVFNRWGEMVFHTKNAAACWDGTFKGIPQATGTFVYQIRAKTACGDVYKKGTVLLIR